MPRPKKISSLESLVDQIVNRAASEIAATVRLSISEEVRRLVGTGAKAAPSAAPAQKAPAAKQPAKAAKPKGRKPGRKARGVDPGLLDKVLGYIGKNPNQRTEAIKAALGGDGDAVKAALAKLRADGKVKTKGQKRATTYSAA